MVVCWTTKLRGFLKHLSNCLDDVEFVQKNTYYETSSKSASFKSKLIRLRILNPIGLFQVIKVSGKDCDCYGAYNRFLDADKPYFIYLENPTALYHYTLGRVNCGIGKKRFKECLNDPNLKYIVCMSQACQNTFEQVNMSIPYHISIKTIYPLVPPNFHVTNKYIHQKSYSEVVECLYCVQGKRFYTKGGDDVLDAVVRLQNAGCKIHLTIITNIKALRKETLDFINDHNGITLYDFVFTYSELEKVYAKTAILIHPSSDDSSPLTVLEAMKGGCAILGSKLYAIPEMVEHNKNGLLVDPKYWSFTPENLPNPKAWRHKSKVKLSNSKSKKYSDDIHDALYAMYRDRDLLYRFSKSSFDIANTKFDPKSICNEWDDVWKTLGGNVNYET